jgi:methionyl-tRNA synthetase
MIDFHDHFLVAKFSNLVNRCLVFTTKLNGERIPDGDIVELFSIETLKNDVHKNLELFQTKNILGIIFVHLDIVNKFISNMKPWEKGDNHLAVIRTVLESVYILGHFLYPFMPSTCESLFKFLKKGMVSVDKISWCNLVDDTLLNNYSILFKQIGETKIEKKNKKQ